MYSKNFLSAFDQHKHNSKHFICDESLRIRQVELFFLALSKCILYSEIIFELLIFIYVGESISDLIQNSIALNMPIVSCKQISLAQVDVGPFIRTLFVFYENASVQNLFTPADSWSSLSTVLKHIFEHCHSLSNFRLTAHMHQPAAHKSCQQHIHMHHWHETAGICLLRLLDVVKDTSK